MSPKTTNNITSPLALNFELPMGNGKRESGNQETEDILSWLNFTCSHVPQVELFLNFNVPTDIPTAKGVIRKPNIFCFCY